MGRQAPRRQVELAAPRRAAIREQFVRSWRLVLAFSLILAVAVAIAPGPGQRAVAGTNQNTYVTLTKTASQPTISGPTSITYTYTITNRSSAYPLYWLRNGMTAAATLTDDKCTTALGGTWSGGTTYSFTAKNGAPAYSNVVVPNGFLQDSTYYGNIYLPIGASATIKCTQTISATTTDTVTLKGLRLSGGTDVVGTAGLSTTETVTYTAPAVADLAVAKIVSPNTTVAAGQDVTYTITVSNKGADSTNKYTLTDTIRDCCTIW